MKRFLCLILSAVLCVIFSSCTNKNIKYVKQGNISFNYNNIFAGFGGPYFWVDENGVYRVEDGILGVCSVINETGKRFFVPRHTPRTDMHTYNGELFFLASSDFVEYSLVKYDISSKKETEIVTFQPEGIHQHQYCIFDNTLYVETGSNEEYVQNITAISLKTNEITNVANDVFWWGVADGAVRYIMRSNDEYKVYQYDAYNNTSFFLGQFETELQNSEFFERGVNFTSDTVILELYDPTNFILRMIVYNVKTGEISTHELSCRLNCLVAYDKYIFVATIEESENDPPTRKNKLFRVCLENFQMEEIGDFYGDDIYLFVTSDNDVFVASSDFDEIYHCTSQGIGENILVNKK